MSLTSRLFVGENKNGGGIGNETNSSEENSTSVTTRWWDRESFTGVLGHEESKEDEECLSKAGGVFISPASTMSVMCNKCPMDGNIHWL
jgi:hypothetical protein